MIAPQGQELDTRLLVGGILGGAVFVIVVYFALMYVKPGVEKFSTETATLQTQIQKNKEKLQEYESYLSNQEERRMIEEKFSSIAKRLPSGQDTVDVYDLLRTYFKGSNVIFTNLEPGNSVNRGRFREYPFTIRGTAEYHSFGQLINLVECNPDRLMHVTNMKLTNNPKRPSSHPMEVGIATFTFNEQ